MVAVVATLLAVVRGLRVDRTRSSTPGCSAACRSAPAALVSLLTGYAFATAIIGGAVFVDRVLYGGPDEQRLALGALAGATAVGALVSGFLCASLALRLVTLVGLALSVGGLLAMSRWTPATTSGRSRSSLGAFGLGFGLTVTPALDGRRRGRRPSARSAPPRRS